MSEVTRVLERLERIDELRRSGAGSQEILAELRGLMGDGEAWAAAEGVGVERARAALVELDAALAGAGGMASERRAAGESSEGGCAPGDQLRTNAVV